MFVKVTQNFIAQELKGGIVIYDVLLLILRAAALATSEAAAAKAETPRSHGPLGICRSRHMMLTQEDCTWLQSTLSEAAAAAQAMSNGLHYT
mmetsp:Transcript_3267/g.5599  ORF Transcript_3267/g.5599 Transcript_3267/m.5599 type:complete len:92 (+) Transcript_3267:820-1095(+)